MRTFAFLLVSALLPALAFADCIDDAAKYHQVDARLVRAIAQVESRMRPDAVGANTDGSTDIGLMQINSSWVPSLARYGITRAHLFDACVNAYVGSWILSRNIQQLGLTWDAVGAYNAKSPAKRLIYAQKVYQALATISSTPFPATANLESVARPTNVPRIDVAPRAAAHRRRPSASSDITVVSWEPPNE